MIPGVFATRLTAEIKEQLEERHEMLERQRVGEISCRKRDVNIPLSGRGDGGGAALPAHSIMHREVAHQRS